MLFLCSAVCLYAQSGSFLLSINGEKISRAEFEEAYRKQNFQGDSINEFLQQFVDRRLKITEARSLKLDTTPEYLAAIAEYERKNDFNLLSVIEAGQPLWEQYCQQQKSLPQSERVKVMQIFKAMPQNSTAVEQEKTIQAMDVLYAQLAADSLVDFADYVNKYSEDKRCVEVGRLETLPEFEQTVFSMNEGQISKPFITPSGIHIVKVIAKRRMPTEEEMADTFRSRMIRKYKGDHHLSFLQYAKDMLNYLPDPGHIKELLIKGDTRGVLFTLDGTAYTGADFHTFAENNPKGIKRQFDDYVTKMILDDLQAKAERESSASDSTLESRNEDILIAEITRREVTDKAREKAGLTAYFSVHKKEYRWEYPRFKGVILHTRNKKQFRVAKKLVKKKPFEDWTSIITTHFNTGDQIQIEAEQGIFAPGDNAFVDKLVFKQGIAPPHLSFPSTYVIGKKVKGPERYEEALEAVLSDYENYLEKRWLEHLHGRYRVEINEEVLKTVNNHRTN